MAGGRIWSEVEDEIVRGGYPVTGSDVFRELAGRSRRSVQFRASLLGLRVDQCRVCEIKKSNLKNSPRFAGKSHSEDSRKKISQSHKGKKFSEQSRLKMRLANLGKSQSAETREKRAAKLMGHQTTCKGKPRSAGSVAKQLSTRREIAAARVSAELNLLTEQLTRNGVLS